MTNANVGKNFRELKEVVLIIEILLLLNITGMLDNVLENEKDLIIGNFGKVVYVEHYCIYSVLLKVVLVKVVKVEKNKHCIFLRKVKFY